MALTSRSEDPGGQGGRGDRREVCSSLRALAEAPGASRSEGARAAGTAWAGLEAGAWVPGACKRGWWRGQGREGPMYVTLTPPPRPSSHPRVAFAGLGEKHKGRFAAAAAAAKSVQSSPTLCDPINGSPPGSPVPGILQARTLEWVVISFSGRFSRTPQTGTRSGLGVGGVTPRRGRCPRLPSIGRARSSAASQCPGCALCSGP